MVPTNVRTVSNWGFANYVMFDKINVVIRVIIW